jgi:hypothetical protein
MNKIQRCSWIVSYWARSVTVILSVMRYEKASDLTDVMHVHCCENRTKVQSDCVPNKMIIGQLFGSRSFIPLNLAKVYRDHVQNWV